MESLNNVFDAPRCPFIKCFLNRSIFHISTQCAAFKCIYQRDNRIMLLGIEQIPDTIANSPYLISWIIYHVYCFEEILMRFSQLRSKMCQNAQITVIVFDLLKHFINHSRSLEEQCSKCVP